MNIYVTQIFIIKSKNILLLLSWKANSQTLFLLKKKKNTLINTQIKVLHYGERNYSNQVYKYW